MGYDSDAPGTTPARRKRVSASTSFVARIGLAVGIPIKQSQPIHPLTPGTIEAQPVPQKPTHLARRFYGYLLKLAAMAIVVLLVSSFWFNLKFLDPMATAPSEYLEDWVTGLYLPFPGQHLAGAESTKPSMRTSLYHTSSTLPSNSAEDDVNAFPQLNKTHQYYREFPKKRMGSTIYAAVCLTGIPRSPALTFMNQKTNFFSILKDHTIFIYAVPDLHFYDLFLYRPTIISVQPQEYLNVSVNGHFNKSPLRMQGWLQQIYAMHQCNQMRKQFEEKHGVTHDWLIRSRFDLWFNQPMDVLNDLDPSSVHIPSEYGGEHGFNDRFAAVPRQYMDLYSSQFLETDQFRGEKITPEVFLKDHLERHNVSVVLHPWTMSLMRENAHLDFPGNPASAEDDK